MQNQNNEDKQIQPEELPSESDLHLVRFSRRSLFRVAVGSSMPPAIALLGLRAAGYIKVDKPEAEGERISQPAMQLIGEEFGRDSRSMVRTLIETIVVWAGQRVTSEYLAPQLSKLGIEYGNHAGRDEPSLDIEPRSTRRESFVRYLYSNIIAPSVEEFCLRIFPSALLGHKGPLKMHWEVGLPSTVVFGLLHNIGKLPNGDLYFHTRSIPLPQLILGAFCWYTVRKSGANHAIMAHILYNHLCSAYEIAYDLTASKLREPESH